MINILLIEDDHAFAIEVKIFLEAYYPTAKVIHINSAVAAAKVLANRSIDLILLDVILENDQAALNLAKHNAREQQLPLIFMTAFKRDDLFKQAVRLQPANYLQKPFSGDSLKYAIELALAQPKAPPKVMYDALLLHTRDGQMEKVNIANILYLQSYGNYCYINTLEQRYYKRMTIKDYATTFPIVKFVRIFRTFVINIDYLATINTQNKEVVLENGTRLSYSNKYRKELFERFGGR